ncbi:MAG: NAD-dependent epimerase/dehydratase family protein, partial [Candidatus Xenobia bacterium]
MNILLIGHRGYLGSGLHAWFSHRHRVVGWDKDEDLFKLDANVLRQNRIDVVVNMSVMADRHSTRFLIDTPCDTVNVGGARHLAQILAGTDIMWIQMSTREVLGPVYTENDVEKTEAGYRPRFLVDENRPYAPANFYARSKIMAEFISESHPRSNILRLSTGYTDFDHTAASWVLVLLKNIAAGRPVSLTRGGEQFRDPVHTDDLGHLMELLYEKGVAGEKLHVGGGSENLISLREFVRCADPSAAIQETPGGDFGFAFDIARAHRLTGWQPSVRVRERIPHLMSTL